MSLVLDQLVNGSILVNVNGLFYLSDTDQTNTTLGYDFHMIDAGIIIRDLPNQGTITLKDSDVIGIYYQLQKKV